MHAITQHHRHNKTQKQLQLATLHPKCFKTNTVHGVAARVGNGDGRGGVGRRHVINKVMRFASVGSEMSSSQVQFTPAERTTQLNKAPKAQASRTRLSALQLGFIKFNNVIY